VLKGHRLAIVMAAADKLPAEKRAVFLDRVAARLRALGSASMTMTSTRRCAKLSRADPGFGSLMAPRRFPPPWSVEELDALGVQVRAPATQSRREIEISFFR
jgi:hypothetical protein